MQALILTGYNEFYTSTTGQTPGIIGEDSLVDVVSIHDTGAIVDNGLVSTFVPFDYLDIQGVYHEIISQARQTDQS